MKPGVYGHRRAARVPGAEQDFRIGGIVLHGESDPVAGLKTKVVPEGARNLRGPRGMLGVGCRDLRAAGEGGAVRHRRGCIMK